MLFDAKRWTLPEIPLLVERESETVKVLKRARARIEQAWCSYGHSDDRGGVCAVVAISRQYTHAAILNGAADEAFELLRQAIPTISIPAWNDATGRTKAEVLAAFDRAIAMARR